jgi:hypothetical protein
MMKLRELKFIHITKCAGTFIEDIGKLHGIKWGRFHEEYGFWHDIFIDKSLSLKETYDWFVIVRNPYNRILSEYYCKWGGIGNNQVHHTIDEFNEYLINNIKNRNKFSGTYKYGHYFEQYKYIDNTTNTTVVKYENLYDDLAVLFKKYSINIDIMKYNTKINSQHSVSDRIFTTADFNSTLICLINEVYAKDFELFNYKKRI